MVRPFPYGVLALCLFAVLAVAGRTAPSDTRTDGPDFRAFQPRIEAGSHPKPAKGEGATPCKAPHDLTTVADLDSTTIEKQRDRLTCS